MSYRECLSNGIKEGVIKEELGKEQLELIENLERRFIGEGLNPTTASKEAAEQAYKMFQHQTIKKKQRALLQLQAQRQNQLDLDTYIDVNGKNNLGEAAVNMLDWNSTSKILNITNLIKETHGRITKNLFEYIVNQRARTAGSKTKTQKVYANLVYKEFKKPGSTGDEAAKNMAREIKVSNNKAVELLNKYGADIHKLADDWLPQNWSRAEMNRVDFDTFRKDMFDWMVMDKMINYKTGLKFTKPEIELILPKIFDDIRTGGWSSKKASGVFQSKGIIANKRKEHRFFHFSDEGYTKFMDKYSDGDLFSNLMQHYESVARDVSIMRKFGPNENAGKTYIKTYVKTKGARLPAKELNQLNKDLKMFDNLFEFHKGILYGAVDSTLALSMAATRQILVSAMLGSASLIAQTDFNYSRITAKFNGLPAHRANKRTLQLLKEGMGGDKTLTKVAMRLGVVADNFLAINYAATRYAMDVQVPVFAKAISDITLRWSGLSHLTQSGRLAFGMEFMGFLGDNFGKNIDELPKPLKSSLERYGISKDDWDLIRKTQLYDAAIDDPKIKKGEAMFFRPDDLLERTDLTDNVKTTLNSRVFNMILTETEHAIPSSSAKGRLTVTGASQPGTPVGELALSVLMFKNFPITMGFTHISRGLKQKGMTGKAAYLIPFLVSTTLVAAMAHEQRELFKGRKMTNLEGLKSVKYWVARMVQGGGLAIFGDLINSQVNEDFPVDLGKAIMGPPVSFVGDTVKLAYSALKAGVGADSNIGADFSRYVRRYTPGSSIFWLRAAWERIIVDSLESMINPNFHKKNRNQIKRYQKDQNREYWWQPGETLPSDTPGISQ